MANSRIEKYKEYRKAIIAGELSEQKVTIETSLKTTSTASGNLPSADEVLFLKRIKLKNFASTSLYLLFTIAVIALLTIFGLKLF